MRDLAYLRRAGLVIARKEGLWNYYRLAPTKSEFHQKLLPCLESCFREMPELAQDAEQLKKSIRQWCCYEFFYGHYMRLGEYLTVP